MFYLYFRHTQKMATYFGESIGESSAAPILSVLTDFVQAMNDALKKHDVREAAQARREAAAKNKKQKPKGPPKDIRIQIAEAARKREKSKVSIETILMEDKKQQPKRQQVAVRLDDYLIPKNQTLNEPESNKEEMNTLTQSLSISSSGSFDDHSVEANNPSRKSRPDRRGDLLDTILKKSNVSKRKLSPRPDKSPTKKNGSQI